MDSEIISNTFIYDVSITYTSKKPQDIFKYISHSVTFCFLNQRLSNDTIVRYSREPIYSSLIAMYVQQLVLKFIKRQILRKC